MIVEGSTEMAGEVQVTIDCGIPGRAGAVLGRGALGNRVRESPSGRLNKKVENTYVVLLRGVNVGGKNKVPMVDLRKCLEDLGFSNVSTVAASGNVILASDRHPDESRTLIEAALTQNFELDSEIIKVLVLSHEQLQAVVDNRPPGFGDQPGKYYSDAIFLMDIDAADAMPVFNPREGVDKIWPGNGVIYSQRLSAERTKSRLSTAMTSPLYKSMTIRSWSTTVKLLNFLKSVDVDKET